jgi:hypothetical protein
MGGSELVLQAKCPRCGASLMSPDVVVDGRPSVDLLADVGGAVGHIHLSPVYGNFHKRVLGVHEVPGSVETISCPRCLVPFPVRGACACGAPLVELDLVCGGLMRFCTRDGCREHHLEFEEPDDAFLLYENQGE